MEVDRSKDKSLRELDGLLERGSSEEVSRLTGGEEYKEMFKNRSSDLIAIVGKHVGKSRAKDKELLECCETLLDKVSRESCPEEALLEFIEQAEECDDVKFVVMLRAIRGCLLNLGENWANPVEWSVNTVLRHLSAMEVPEDRKLEGEEKMFLENDTTLDDIGDVYAGVIEFYGTVMEENERRRGDPDILLCKDYTFKSLIKLLGKPMVFMDLGSGKTKSKSRVQAEIIVGYIAKHRTDPLKFLEVSKTNSQTVEEEEESRVLLESEFENTSLGVYFYLLYGEGVGVEDLPQVYSPVFVLENCVRLAHALTGFSHAAAQIKGLLLARAVLLRLPDRSLDYDTADYTAYGKFMESLTGIMSYSDVKENRRVAVEVFRLLLYKLDSVGRYVVLLNIQDVAPQPGFLGYLATLVKDVLAEVLSSPGGPDEEYFTGKCLHDLLTKLCRLKRGAESDLVELSDSIVSSLNLLRFLVIRDSRNVTGIWELIPVLERDFLEPLKRGVVLSQAHYRLQKQEVASRTSADADVTVTIAGSVLPRMPRAQKLHVLDSALNIFDLIDSLLSRVKECIQLYVK